MNGKEGGHDDMLVEPGANDLHDKEGHPNPESGEVPQQMYGATMYGVEAVASALSPEAWARAMELVGMDTNGVDAVSQGETVRRRRWRPRGAWANRHPLRRRHRRRHRRPLRRHHRRRHRRQPLRPRRCVHHRHRCHPQHWPASLASHSLYRPSPAS